MFDLSVLPKKLEILSIVNDHGSFYNFGQLPLSLERFYYVSGFGFEDSLDYLVNLKELNLNHYTNNVMERLNQFDTEKLPPNLTKFVFSPAGKYTSRSVYSFFSYKKRFFIPDIFTINLPTTTFFLELTSANSTDIKFLVSGGKKSLKIKKDVYSTLVKV